jgi:hypothetical protein
VDEFDDRPLRNVKHLGTDIDDALTEVEALIEGATAAKCRIWQSSN